MTNNQELPKGYDRYTSRDKRVSFATGCVNGAYAAAVVGTVGAVGATVAVADGGGAVAVAGGGGIAVGIVTAAIVSFVTGAAAAAVDCAYVGPVGAAGDIHHQQSKNAGGIMGVSIPMAAAFFAGSAIYYDGTNKPVATLVQDNAQIQVHTQRNVCDNPMIQAEIDRLRAHCPPKALTPS